MSSPELDKPTEIEEVDKETLDRGISKLKASEAYFNKDLSYLAQETKKDRSIDLQMIAYKFGFAIAVGVLVYLVVNAVEEKTELADCIKKAQKIAPPEASKKELIRINRGMNEAVEQCLQNSPNT